MDYNRGPTVRLSAVLTFGGLQIAFLITWFAAAGVLRRRLSPNVPLIVIWVITFLVLAAAFGGLAFAINRIWAARDSH